MTIINKIVYSWSVPVSLLPRNRDCRAEEKESTPEGYLAPDSVIRSENSIQLILLYFIIF